MRETGRQREAILNEVGIWESSAKPQTKVLLLSGISCGVWSRGGGDVANWELSTYGWKPLRMLRGCTQPSP